jgi:hypothetical protein
MHEAAKAPVQEYNMSTKFFAWVVSNLSKRLVKGEHPDLSGLESRRECKERSPATPPT